MFVVFLDRPLTNTPLEPLGTIAPLMAFFLWEKKKKKKEEMERKRRTTTTTQQKEQERRENKNQNAAWNKRVFGHDGWSFLSLSLCSSASLSL